ncbi:hypothetical protein [Altererythrobacter sp. C41]|uniref:hypothetical protein n=1 Tax=Altererythrobacter sp. C41 TaxID=2806021 RepID=UPI0019341B9B|nr:hypothetical protein [Altererythrobacter sp. C41]MBM0168702.1 hypothetical protein [Altererythrobacter sp. C41]
MIKISLAVLLVAIPAAAFALDSDEPPAAKPDEEKVICKREVATGSIMSRRICLTKAEWKALEEQGKADLDRTRAMERSRSLVNENL